MLWVLSNDWSSRGWFVCFPLNIYWIGYVWVGVCVCIIHTIGIVFFATISTNFIPGRWASLCAGINTLSNHWPIHVHVKPTSMYNRTTHRSKIDDLRIATKKTRASTVSCDRACAFIDLPSFLFYDSLWLDSTCQSRQIFMRGRRARCD